MKGAHTETKLRLIMMDDGEEIKMDFSQENDPFDAMLRTAVTVNNMENFDMGTYRTHQKKKEGLLYITKVCH